MQILYIGRDYSKLPARRRVRQWFRRNHFNGQEGYFEASLNAVAKVVRGSTRDLESLSPNLSRDYGCVIVNFKGLPASLQSAEALKPVLAPIRTRKALLVANAEAGNLAEDNLLDLFDLVFKREHFRDLDRYRISTANKRKLRTTMLSCPLVTATRSNLHHPDIIKIGHRTSSRVDQPYDVFFSGAMTNRIRMEAWQQIVTSDLHYCGGLQPKTNAPAPEKVLQERKLTLRKYVELIRKTKVNLAIDGYGEFTYRHLELWCLGAFMLTTPSIRDLQLPMDTVEGMHYAVFEDIDDLVDKIKYYSKKHNKRKKIQKEGQSMFLNQYNFKKHGEEILRSIEAI